MLRPFARGFSFGFDFDLINSNNNDNKKHYQNLSVWLEGK